MSYRGFSRELDTFIMWENKAKRLGFFLCELVDVRN